MFVETKEDQNQSYLERSATFYLPSVRQCSRVREANPKMDSESAYPDWLGVVFNRR